MLIESRDGGSAPDGVELLLDLIMADMRALLDLQRDRLWVMELTAV